MWKIRNLILNFRPRIWRSRMAAMIENLLHDVIARCYKSTYIHIVYTIKKCLHIANTINVHIYVSKWIAVYTNKRTETNRQMKNFAVMCTPLAIQNVNTKRPFSFLSHGTIVASKRKTEAAVAALVFDTLNEITLKRCRPCLFCPSRLSPFLRSLFICLFRNIIPFHLKFAQIYRQSNC